MKLLFDLDEKRVQVFRPRRRCTRQFPISAQDSMDQMFRRFPVVCAQLGMGE